MIRYILECLAFQLLFLIIYDLFLKRETFFQWNRAYLLGTFVLSLLLPWIKIEALKTTVSPEYFVYPEYLWDMEGPTAIVGASKPPVGLHLSTPEIIFYVGMFLSTLLFGYKLYQIIQLKRKGETRHFKRFTRVMVAESSMAFSFFRSIFIGDRVPEEDYKSIVQHELVHIEQRHSWDLLFFESMRIIGWFNPLVYVYQSRISELHEFIADAQVAKTHKAEQYQLLLSQVFQTRYISFVNPFFKTSLIKKRIVMLQKSESKQIWRLKYLLMLPLVMGMLVYTSATGQDPEQDVPIDVPFSVVEEVPVFPGCEGASDPRACFNEKLQAHVAANFRYPEEAQKEGIQGRVNIMFVIQKDGSIGDIMMRGPDKLLEEEAGRIISLLPKMTPGKQRGQAVRVPFSLPVIFKLDSAAPGDSQLLDPEIIVDVPFGVVEEVPIFPGCEGASDPRACFNEKLQEHIRDNFRYPEEAQNQGIQGQVAVLFIIQKDGSIGDIKLRGPHKLLEDEVERITTLLPKMTPGKQREKAVRVPFSFPVIFKLDSAAPGDSQLLDPEVMVDMPFGVVEEVPIFPGCEGASDPRACFHEKMQEHIRENFRYPEEAQKQHIQGRVNTIFIIGEDGSIEGIKERGPDKLLEEEAARILSLLPKMIPGKQRGQAVRVPYSIPITFKLDPDQEDMDKSALSNMKLANALIFIDGKESSQEKLDKLNPDSIKSVNIIKDKEQLKKYGEKAKNGVILITTKK